MTSKQILLNQLINYKGSNETEEEHRLKIIDFVKKHKDCFSVEQLQGHVTGSALIIDQSFKHTLLTHHLKLDKWFQFGGHNEAGENIIETAKREAKEESGLVSLKDIPKHEGVLMLMYNLSPKERVYPNTFITI